MAAAEPIFTRELVAQFLLGPFRQATTIEGFHFEVIRVNGQPAFRIRTNEGIHSIGIFHVENRQIRNIYLVRNPDKLKHAAE